MKIVTCNIRYLAADDGGNSWPLRKDACVDIIHSRSPELICCQEMWRSQYDYLLSASPGFSAFGLEDEPHGGNPMNAIFYRRDVFRWVSAGGYWLSETPHVSGSRSWDSACVRLANWLRLEELSSGIEFRIVNTHLDHVSQSARENQARLLCEDATAYAPEYPQLLAGDMNCDAGNQVIEALRDAGWRDTYEIIHGVTDPGGTYHAFKGPDFESATGKMDWVFCRGDVQVADAEIITDTIDGRFPSDHYFVSADVTL